VRFGLWRGTEVPLEGHRLLNVKLLEIPMLVVNLEAVYGLCSRIHGCLAIAFGVLQKAKNCRLIRSLSAWCFVMVDVSYFKSLFTVG